MSISFRICFIAIQLFAIANLIQAYVLITANVDDLKKIARKFIPDSLAEKLADYIVRATNIDPYSAIINENRAQREDNEKDYFQPPKTTKNKNRYINRETVKQSTTKKSRFKIAEKSSNTNVKPKVQKQYVHSISPPAKSQIINAEYTANKQDTFFSSDENNPSNMQHNIQKRPKYEATTDSKKLIEFSSNISKYVENKIKDKKLAKEDKGEYDPYENTNYVKQEKLASSGPVSLPKFNLQSWFEGSIKEQESDNNN